MKSIRSQNVNLHSINTERRDYSSTCGWLLSYRFEYHPVMQMLFKPTFLPEFIHVHTCLVLVYCTNQSLYEICTMCIQIHYDCSFMWINKIFFISHNDTKAWFPKTLVGYLRWLAFYYYPSCLRESKRVNCTVQDKRYWQKASVRVRTRTDDDQRDTVPKSTL